MGGRGERHGVGVRMTPAMLERHSGISAAPTAGLRGATSRVYTARSAHDFMRLAAMHAMRHDAHGPPRHIDALDFYSIYIGGLDREKRTRARDRNDLRRRPAIVAGPALLPPRAKNLYSIYIQNERGYGELMIYEAIVVTYLRWIKNVTILLRGSVNTVRNLNST